MTSAVKRHLVEIFKAVADACDGSDEVTEDIRNAYNTALEDPEVREFYGQLVEVHHFEVFGES